MDDKYQLANITEIKPLHKVRYVDNLKAMMQENRELFGEKTAFRFRQTPQSEIQSKSYREACDDMMALGSALLDLGLNRPQIAIIGENRYEWIISFLAAINGAGIAVPLDKMLPSNEIQRMLTRGEVDIVIYSESFHETVMAIAKGSEKIKACVCMNPGAETDFNAEMDSKCHSFNKMLEKGYKLIKSGYTKYADIKPDTKSMSVLLFTSGTSASSKAVMLSQENICSDIIALGGTFFAESRESVLSILPLHHTFENTAGLLYPLFLGMTVSISDGLKYLSKNLAEHSPDVLVGVPLIFEKFRNKAIEEIKKRGMTRQVNLMMRISNLLRYIGIDIRRNVFKKLLEPFGGRLRAIITGGAAMEADLARWYESIGICVHQGYGLTETSPVVAGCNDRVRKAGTCGEPLPGIKVAIANQDKKGTGEIVVQGKTVMLGYWKDQAATREAIVDGWFHTGDLGKIDKRGLLHVTGRVKSMIVLKNGKKVFPEELESLINKLAYVKESLVWGEPLGNGHVEICAKIILDPESIPCDAGDEEAIRKLLDQAIKDANRQMPAYKAIRYYVFSFDELVKTTTLKVKRYVETDQIHKVLTGLAATIKTACGRNFDKLKEMTLRGIPGSN